MIDLSHNKHQQIELDATLFDLENLTTSKLPGNWISSFQFDADSDDPNRSPVVQSSKVTARRKISCYETYSKDELLAKIRVEPGLQLWLWRSWGKLNQWVKYGQVVLDALDAIHVFGWNGSCSWNPKATCFRTFSAGDSKLQQITDVYGGRSLEAPVSRDVPRNTLRTYHWLPWQLQHFCHPWLCNIQPYDGKLRPRLTWR